MEAKERFRQTQEAIAGDSESPVVICGDGEVAFEGTNAVRAQASWPSLLPPPAFLENL